MARKYPENLRISVRVSDANGGAEPDSVDLDLEVDFASALDDVSVDELLAYIEETGDKGDIADYLGKDYCMEHFNLKEDNNVDE